MATESLSYNMNTVPVVTTDILKLLKELNFKLSINLYIVGLVFGISISIMSGVNFIFGAAFVCCSSLIDACQKQHFDCAESLLEKHKGNNDALAALVKEKTKDGALQTPLHIAAEKGNAKIANLLLNNGASCLEQDKRKLIPIMCACLNGHKKVVKLLIKAGSPVTYEVEDTIPVTEGSNSDGGSTGANNGGSNGTSNRGSSIIDIDVSDGGSNGASDGGSNDAAANNSGSGSSTTNKRRKHISVLMKAINRKQEGVAMAILDSHKAPEALKFFTFDDKGKKVNALRRAIETRMPAIVERILWWYTNKIDPADTDNDKVKVTFEYKLIDDLAFESASNNTASTSTGSIDNRNPGTEEQGNLCRKTLQSKYDANNHCLNLLVNSNDDENIKLVRHPLVTSLLYQKWTIYAQLAFAFNLFLHLLYTLSLTVFATTVYQPRSEACTAKNSSSTCDAADGHFVSAGVFSGIALALSILRLCFEVFQLVKLRRNYFSSWINYLELLMCIFSGIFVFVYTMKCFCPASWQWQIGTLSVFFAWIDFIHFLKIIPLFGIYVVMFGTIVKNFLKVVILAGLLIMSFAIPFYMLFNDPLLHKGLRTPFNGVGRSIMKTLTMTTGEFDFDTMFRQDYTEDPSIPYGVSFLFWIAFIALMPILLNNLLTGLAVDDVNEIRENAKIKTLCIWINYLQLVEQILPEYFYRKHREKIKEEWKITLEDFHKRSFWPGFQWLEGPFSYVERNMWYETLEFDHLVHYDHQILPSDDAASQNTEELLEEVRKLTTEMEAMKKKFISIEALKDANAELLKRGAPVCGIITEVETMKPKVPAVPNHDYALEDTALISPQMMRRKSF